MKVIKTCLGIVSILMMLSACNSNDPDKTTADLIGSFSLGDNVYVFISKGNLQYQPSTGIWRFAEHQYDVVYKNGKNIKSTDEWIDEYQWGTGNNPLGSGYDHQFIDWGTNAISNGENKANLWRTLGSGEWKSLYANNPHEYVSVCGVTGMIMYPNHFNLPSDIEWELDNNKKKCNAEQWAKLENAGAIFIPALDYWTRTEKNDNQAYFCDTHGYAVKIDDGSRGNTFHVRLVKNVK